jgi:hypothetical protein
MMGSMPRFTVQQMLFSTTCFAVSCAGWAAIETYDVIRRPIIALPLFCGMFASFGAGIGAFWGEPRAGAIIGLIFMPPACMVLLGIAVDRGWVSFF